MLLSSGAGFIHKFPRILPQKSMILAGWRKNLQLLLIFRVYSWAPDFVSVSAFIYVAKNYSIVKAK